MDLIQYCHVDADIVNDISIVLQKQIIQQLHDKLIERIHANVPNFSVEYANNIIVNTTYAFLKWRPEITATVSLTAAISTESIQTVTTNCDGNNEKI